MKHSYLLAGIKANRFITMIARNKGFSSKYTLKFLFLLNAGLWSLIFSFIERRRYGSKIKQIAKIEEPVFIVGNWRTGTTFLHQLLSLDTQFTSPSVYQVSNPDHFLVSKKYYSPIMTKALGNKRPMDNVKIGIDEPQEDEYALLKMCRNTPLEKLIFNNSKSFFLDAYDDFLPENEKKFTNALMLLVKKLSLDNSKRVLFKNPFHSLRIPLLKKLFSEAKYIHIYRDPNAVIPSSIHMWNIVGSQNKLKGKWVSPSVKSIANLYRKIILAVRSELGAMQNDQKIEISFEQLEQDPVACVKRIYNTLNMVYTEKYNSELLNYCDQLKAYKKNSYNTSEKDRNQIKETLETVLPEYF